MKCRSVCETAALWVDYNKQPADAQQNAHTPARFTFDSFGEYCVRVSESTVCLALFFEFELKKGMMNRK